MHLLPRCASTLCILLALCVARVSAYFVITEPQTRTEWVNGEAHVVQWSKGLLDDIYGFDVEMARLSSDGLTLVAMNVPASQGKLNILLQNVPAGDDYFLIFINSTHGFMHAASPRFTVLDASATPTSPPGLTAAPGIPTVTISGTPHPTLQFATTFPALALSGGRGMVLGGRGAGMGVGVTAMGVVLGALCTLGW